MSLSLAKFGSENQSDIFIGLTSSLERTTGSDEWLFLIRSHLFAARGRSVPAFCERTNMKWEYKTVKLGATGLLGGKVDEAQLDRTMNELGAQG